MFFVPTAPDKGTFFFPESQRDRAQIRGIIENFLKFGNDSTNRGLRQISNAPPKVGSSNRVPFAGTLWPMLEFAFILTHVYT